jgi:hypothetical protein
VQAEDVGPVIVTDRVQEAAGGHDVAEVQVGDQGLLALPHWPGEDLTAGRDVTVLPSSIHSPFCSRY